MEDNSQRSWDRIAIPVLHATLAAEKADRTVHGDELREVVPDVSDREFHFVLASLARERYVEARSWTDGGEPYPEYASVRLGPRGRRAIGDWPSGDAFDVLLSRLDHAIRNAHGPDERGRLERLRTTLLEVGQGVLTRILSDVLTEVAGI